MVLDTRVEVGPCRLAGDGLAVRQHLELGGSAPVA